MLEYYFNIVISLLISLSTLDYSHFNQYGFDFLKHFFHKIIQEQLKLAKSFNKSFKELSENIYKVFIKPLIQKRWHKNCWNLVDMLIQAEIYQTKSNFLEFFNCIDFAYKTV